MFQAAEVFLDIIRDPQFIAANELLCTLDKNGFQVVIGEGGPRLELKRDGTPNLRKQEYYKTLLSELTYEVELCYAMRIIGNHASGMLQTKMTLQMGQSSKETMHQG